MVEKHTPQHVISETRRSRCEAETMCTYNNLATEQGDDDVRSIVDRQEPTGDCWWSASHIGRGREKDETTTKNRRRVKVVRTGLKVVGHQAPQQLGSLVARRDNDNEETVIPAKRP